MDWLDGVADVVEETVKGFERPAGAAEGFPDGGVVGKGAKGDEGVVGGAATEDFGARVSDVRVSCKSMDQSGFILFSYFPCSLEALTNTVCSSYENGI